VTPDRVIEDFLLVLDQDDPAAVAAFLGQHEPRRAELEAAAGRHAALVPELRAWAQRQREAALPEGHGSPPALGDGVSWRTPGYQLLEEIGRGGMGVVYRARELATDRVVALKVIAVREGAATAERFQREVKAIAAVTSPHVVTLYHSGAIDGAFYYTMSSSSRPSLPTRSARISSAAPSMTQL
jgi:serine/threonine protein kinase